MTALFLNVSRYLHRASRRRHHKRSHIPYAAAYRSYSEKQDDFRKAFDAFVNANLIVWTNSEIPIRNCEKPNGPGTSKTDLFHHKI